MQKHTISHTKGIEFFKLRIAYLLIYWLTLVILYMFFSFKKQRYFSEHLCMKVSKCFVEKSFKKERKRKEMNKFPLTISCKLRMSDC